jgi:hypothetical protein
VAELARAVASLRITGDDLVPAEVTALLGAEPSNSFTRGEPQPLSQRPRQFGLWSLQSASTEPADVDAQIDEILAQLTPDMTVWAELAQRFNVDLFCGWFMKWGNEGVSLDPASLTALGDRNILLDLDLYAGDPEVQ